MIVFPNAKINLGLFVTSKRKDGYHELQSCMYPIPLCDALEIQTCKKQQFESSGIIIPGEQGENLVERAYKLLKKDFSDLPPICIHLHKHIPIGAGLGGGSADAAFALEAMNRLFELYLEDWILEEYAAQLGSDCPFFIQNTPKIISGRGEIMEPITLDLSGKWIWLVYPNLHISTKEAYAGIAPKPVVSDWKNWMQDTASWKEVLKNDFEDSIFPQYPQLGELKASFYEKGAFYAAMSGSGSSVFGLFDKEPESHDKNAEHFHFISKL